VAGCGGTGPATRSVFGRSPSAAGLYGAEEAKKRLDGVPISRKKAGKPAFVELVAARPEMVAECVIEIESSTGSKMRIHWKGSSTPDWAILLRAWREAER